MNNGDRVLKHAKRAKAKFLVVCAGSLALAAALIVAAPNSGTSESPLLPNNLPFENASGLHATFSTSGSIDLRNEFFQNLGTNGRNCGTCHRAEEAWTITPAGVQARFNRTKGADPIFRTNDGSNSVFGTPAVVNGSCTTCHDTPNSGNHSVAALLNLGLTDAERRTPDMPLYTLRNKATGEIKLTTDPGRALITGHWKDLGRFKGPVLRGLAARAPYFHNGFAKDLKAVIEFYDERFSIGFTEQEKADMLAFLLTL